VLDVARKLVVTLWPFSLRSSFHNAGLDAVMANIDLGWVLWGSAAAFVAAGFVKGTIGVGLPLVAVPLMAHLMPAPRAIALMAVPVMASNLWQAWKSGISVPATRRFAPLLVTLVLFTVLTVPVMLMLAPRVLNAALAGVVIATVLLTALKLRLDLAPRHERWASAATGALAGVVGGVSSVTGPVLITYLMALRLPREDFVGSISVIYLFAGLPLYASMAWHGHLGWTELAGSTAALLPLAAGMALGRRLRQRLDETWFRRALMLFLAAVAVALLFKQP
jgi:uncharacterized membrane protein YfcA